MILFPAIEIKNGECVRLRLGEMRDSKIYNSNPLSQAIKFQEIGFDWVHIVDLDAAVNGKSKNKPIITSKPKPQTYTKPMISSAELDAERKKRIELERKLAAIEAKQKQEQQRQTHVGHVQKSSNVFFWEKSACGMPHRQKIAFKLLLD